MFVLTLAFILSTAALPAGASAQTSDSDCTPHPPIRITEEHGPQGFTWTDPATGETEHRPGNGVVAGNGTLEDPYVIEGWCITPPTTGDAIHLQTTTAHAVIQGNVLDGAGTDDLGVHLDRGVHLTDADNVTIRDNLVTDNGDEGVLVEDSTATVVEANIFANNTGQGVHLFGTDGAAIRGNTIENGGHDGVFVTSASATSIQNNTITGNRIDGVYVRTSTGTTVQDNAVSSNDHGVRIGEPTDTVVRGNNLDGNRQAGLFVGGGGDGPVDATGNWWGAANGPSGEDARDACTGEDADGDEIITVFGGQVCFEPWLENPNPEAGLVGPS